MANKDQNETTDLSKIGDITGVMERPKTLGDTIHGVDFDADEIRLPRLSIAQGLSPEIIEGDSRFIDGLKANDMFNNMTNEIYGRGPLTFVPLRHDSVRIEFIPRSEGGGIRDMDVPKGDPRLKWTGAGKDRQPPVATEFVEFASLLLRAGKAPEPIIISIKMTNKWNRRAADQLTLFIAQRNADIYAGLYKISSKPEKNDKGTFGVPVVQNAGFIPVDLPAGKALYDYAAKLHTQLSGKVITTERQPGDETEFDPSALEGKGGTTEM